MRAFPPLALLALALLFTTGCAGTETGYTSLSASEGDWALDDTPLDRSADELRASTAEHLATARDLFEQILAVEDERTVDNTFAKLDELYLHVGAASNDNDLFAEVHPDEDVREAAREGSQEVSAFVTELSLSRELYDALAAIDTEGLDDETRFAIAKELRDFRRAGVDKSAEVRARITELNDELIELSQAFSENIGSDVREIEVDSLEGLPEDYVAAHPADADGKHVINTTYPDYIPFMRYARSREDRERLYREYTNRGHPANLEVLEQLIHKRHEKAQLLGYENWATYITEDKMIGSPERAQQFIDRVAGAAREAADRDYLMLLERKRQDVPGARQVLDWEKYAYSNLVKQESFDFDSQEARPYFDFEKVQQGLFDVTGRLFGVRYEQVEGLDLWRDDVTAWDMYTGDRLVGRFYLDLHPHPESNKYGHAACFPYRTGVAGKRLPQATLVCNFPGPDQSSDGVALMDFGQVETFFHEFGHLLHALFAGHKQWMNTAGINTEWDFVEAPSQMLEEWVMDTETLQSFAHHHETGEPIPAEMVAKLRAASEFGKGTNTAHQMFYAALSLGLYNRDPEGLDTTATMIELRERYSPFPHVEDTHFQCSFGHLDGYSAIYYTYMWSQVIAKDMFSRFASEGVFNEDTASDYRDEVLAPGGSKPAGELVEDFLGREYSFEAFKEWLERT